MTIKSISLTNFQSHRQTHLDLHPGLNVIIGPSDSGKSSLIRALKWIVENRPSGDEFRSDWAEKEYVECAVTFDGQLVERIKGGSTNIYNLTPFTISSCGETETFQGFGQEVPPPISQALNLSQINTQFQHDRPYLLDESPGQVARTLNQIVHLDMIDTALANIATKKRAVTSEIQATEQHISRLKIAEDQFPDLEAVEAFVSGLEETEARLAQVLHTHNLLTEIQAQIQAISHRIETDKLPAGIEDRISSLTEKQEDLANHRYWIQILSDQNSRITSLRNEISSHEKVLGQAGLADHLTQVAFSLGGTQGAFKKLQKLATDIDSVKRSLKIAQQAIIEAEDEFSEKIGGRCPLCDQPIVNVAR